MQEIVPFRLEGWKTHVYVYSARNSTTMVKLHPKDTANSYCALGLFENVNVQRGRRLRLVVLHTF